MKSDQWNIKEKKIVCDRHKMQGRHFNELKKKKGGWQKGFLIKMHKNRPVFIPTAAFVSVYVTVPTILCSTQLCEKKFNGISG